MADWQETNPKNIQANYLAGDVTKRFRKKVMRDELRQVITKNTGDSTRVVQQIVEYLTERPQLQVVAIFAPMPGEVNLLSLIEMTEKIWVFPKVNSDGLIFQQVKSVNNDLRVGAFGIFEPKKRLPQILPDKIDLFLCPGLGFDKNGGRIGRGKGFYDAALAKSSPDSIKLGVCFGYQLVDEVVMEDHDIRMHGVIA